jgi:hypothetical protein
MPYTPEWSRHVATYKGHKVSLLDVKSFAHKAIRDGDEAAAIGWMRVLYTNGAKCWKQLCIYTVEDIGLADLNTMDEVLLLKTKRGLKKRMHRLGLIYDEIRDGHTEWMVIVLASIICARAKKNRITDDACIWFKKNPTWLPAITQADFDAAKDVTEAVDAGILPPVPDKAWDKHTSLGKKLKRGLKHFEEVASKVKNAAVGIQPFAAPKI